MQRLLMPFKRQMMLAGYKTAQYRSHWGYDHYGVDISTIQGNAGTDPRIYASGNGTVVAAGFDNSGGNVVVIIYPSCLNHRTGKVQDLVARYMHLESIAVKTGDAVTVGRVLGVEGKTKTSDPHLHLEFDTDTRWPLYSPQVSNRDDHLTFAQGNYLRKGTDTTVDPSFVLHRSVSHIIVPPTYNPAWLNPQDNAIPLAINSEPINNDLSLDTIKTLELQVSELSEQLKKERTERAALATKIQNAKNALN